eukprot:m.324016 g.324016  ORF g.324016 m.324016 type:complete len:333 (-) comp20366_c0_seq1:522-1520(-)
MRVVVLGAGTFGTAVGTLFARNGHSVTLVTRNEACMNSINNSHRNCDYLQEYTLPENVNASLSAEAAIKEGCDLILHAIPVQASREVLADLQDVITVDIPVVSLSKGIYLEDLTFMCDVIRKALKHPEHPTAFLSGPSFARELMDGQATGLVIASENEPLAQRIQVLLGSDTVRVYTSPDVIGVEVGGAIKNVFAIACGIASGMGFQYNTAAMIITRGCSEMKKLAVALGAKEATLAGLSGIGDLMLTCFGGASRNRTVGVRLGQGEKLDDIIASMNEVAEGVPTANAAAQLAKSVGLELPIIEHVAAIIAGRMAPAEAMTSLMQIPQGPED